MVLTSKELDAVSEVNPQLEWVICDTTSNDRYELVSALRAANVDYSIVAGSKVLLVRAWTDHAIKTYMETGLEESCTLTDFLLAYKEAK